METSSDGPLEGTGLPTPERIELFLGLTGQFQRRIHLFVNGLVPNAADAEDVLQETSLVLWREFGRFQEGTNFLSWACAVAFNQVLAWRKKQQRNRLVFTDAHLSAVAKDLSASLERQDERDKALAGCLEKLPAHHRELVKGRYSEGQTIEALAEKEGRTVEAVYRMLSRVRAALHECVQLSMGTP